MGIGHWSIINSSSSPASPAPSSPSLWQVKKAMLFFSAQLLGAKHR
ncbi:hypothetical protein COO91_04914 [Nostoc flagelliforme CCNUN1]|uniref:Uncharacterized protein n=1 Tax=Nostoc flagelliforme CCNUN1 TaxID=2038116 RepID=A0A2K8SW05_9NOSO|nr:hypothetical protein COO91_04914 [Nostoc flagelliforme CCNUN1]